MTFDSHSVQQTESFAADFARTLHGGEVLALDGEMGAGKTHFVRGLVEGLGADPRIVSSPTFVLLNIYDTPTLRVFHLDAYRAGGSEDFESIGFTELLDQPGALIVIEWPTRVASLLPAHTMHIHITPTGPNSRTLQITRPA